MIRLMAARQRHVTMITKIEAVKFTDCSRWLLQYP